MRSKGILYSPNDIFKPPSLVASFLSELQIHLKKPVCTLQAILLLADITVNFLYLASKNWFHTDQHQLSCKLRHLSHICTEQGILNFVKSIFFFIR